MGRYICECRLYILCVRVCVRVACWWSLFCVNCIPAHFIRMAYIVACSCKSSSNVWERERKLKPLYTADSGSSQTVGSHFAETKSVHTRVRICISKMELCITVCCSFVYLLFFFSIFSLIFALLGWTFPCRSSSRCAHCAEYSLPSPKRLLSSDSGVQHIYHIYSVIVIVCIGSHKREYFHQPYNCFSFICRYIRAHIHTI